MKPYENVDEYLANFSGETRARLEAIRKTIKGLVPEATEKISYGIPTFTLNGTYLIYYAGYAHHIALYPVGNMESLEKELAPYKVSKGTLRFTLDKPLPLDLIKRFTKLRIRQNLDKTRKK